MLNDQREIQDLKERILRLETQYGFSKEIRDLSVSDARIVSDAESEKGTRARVNTEIDHKLDKLDTRMRIVERLVFIGIGLSLAGQFILAFVLKKP